MNAVGQAWLAPEFEPERSGPKAARVKAFEAAGRQAARP